MEKVIVKKGGADLVFFFPDSPARPGYIECWDAISGHGDASLQYFWGLKKPGVDQDQAINNLIKRYEQHYKTELKRVYKRRVK